jgi:thiol:disulfide interchange protein DsbC
MKKNGFLLCVLTLIAMTFSSGAVFGASDVEESLKTNYPGLKYDSVAPSPVAGLYEVVAGKMIVYYAPKEAIVFAGQMFDKTNKNITAERMQELLARFDKEVVRKAKELPLDKAVKMGSGEHTVIEFTDPDCPFCRKAAQFLDKRTDVTKYTFFMPLDMHPDSKNKVRYIFCQNDRGKAFEEVMSGRIDGVKYETCDSPAVDDLLKLHGAIAAKMGISGTPFFIIDGTVVSGADIPRMELLLGKKKSAKAE